MYLYCADFQNYRIFLCVSNTKLSLDDQAKAFEDCEETVGKVVAAHNTSIERVNKIYLSTDEEAEIYCTFVPKFNK